MKQGDQHTYSQIIQQRKMSKQRQSDLKGAGPSGLSNLQQPLQELKIQQHEPLTQVQRWSEIQKSGNMAVSSQVKESNDSYQRLAEHQVKQEHPTETLKNVIQSRKIRNSNSLANDSNVEGIKESKVSFANIPHARSPTEFENKHGLQISEGKPSIDMSPF